jgi:SAM-dependent methyltransferase
VRTSRRFAFVDAPRCVMCGEQAARVLGRRLDRHQGLRPRRLTGVTTTVVRCRGCGLVYCNPRPVPDDVAGLYDVAPEHYWRDAAPDGEAFTDEIACFRRLWSGAGAPRVLDVGAGTGRAMVAMGHAGLDVWGLEPSPTFRARALALGVAESRLALGTVQDAVYAPASFDLITFGAVLEHLPDPAAALSSVLPWLAPGGLIHVEVPSSRWLVGRALNAVYRLTGAGHVTNLSPMHVPYHLYEFTPDSFARHGARAGYRIAEVRVFAGDTYLPGALSRAASALMERTGSGMQLQLWLRGAAGEARASERAAGP